MDRLEKKINQAIRLIQAYNRWKPLTLAYSGGKDSDTILQICKLAHVPVTIVHNCTTIDPPGTLAHCLDHGAIISRPSATFFQLVQKKGLPSMFRRFCCSELKERFIGTPLILGIRSCESIKRQKRYIEPTACRIYSSKCSSEQVLPIVTWTNEDVKLFHDMENLHFHPLYYDHGQLNINRRLGCIGCPLQSDRGVSDYIKYPQFLKLLAISYSQYVKNHKAVESVYHDIVWQLFYSNHGDKKYQQTYHGLFDAPDPRLFLQNYFKIELPLL